MNRFELFAEIAEREVLRLTPAGLAVSSVTLRHLSNQIEAGQPRDVVMEVRAVAIGAIGERLNNASLGVRFRFTGFLANKTRSMRSLVFHIIEFQELTEE